MPCGLAGHPLGVQGQFYMNSGCHYGGLAAPFLDEDRALDHDFSIHALGVVPGSIFSGFMTDRGLSTVNNYANSLCRRSKSRTC